jgi:anti-sigma28 factor (negative regulator of flagellin synthesis)
VPSEVLEEVLNLLTKKSDEKQRKTREKEEDRAAVNLSHSEGDEQSDEEGNSIIALKKVRKKCFFRWSYG